MWAGGAAVPGWVVTGMLVSGLVSVACVVVGAVRVRGDRYVGYVWLRRAVLVSLLVTQVAVFRLDPAAAMVGVVVDLGVLGVVVAELSVMRAEGAGPGGSGGAAAADAGGAAPDPA